ncbi:MAG: GIY-YIG nuclease family protein [Acidobacteria bacterium]|nr:GIY-YIG nuclease family protein [Acidobacteriota bacterium]
MPCVYILRCGDNTFYVGHTSDVDSRLQWHRAGQGARYTAERLPVDLVYTEECSSIDAAVRRERQLKRWSGQKKAALISRHFGQLKRLSKRRRSKKADDGNAN